VLTVRDPDILSEADTTTYPPTHPSMWIFYRKNVICSSQDFQSFLCQNNIFPHRTTRQFCPPLQNDFSFNLLWTRLMTSENSETNDGRATIFFRKLWKFPTNRNKNCSLLLYVQGILVHLC
jgi:hypothetical protein